MAFKSLLKLSEKIATLVAAAGLFGEHHEKDIIPPSLLVGADADRRTERRCGGAE